MCRSPSKRKKKIYLDYLQNSRGQTLAAAYSLRPTPEARVLFAETSRVFDHVRTVRQTVEDLRQARLGTLSIATIPILGEILLPKVIAALLGERPRVQIRFQVRPRRELLDVVASTSVDLGGLIQAGAGSCQETCASA